MRHPYLQVWPTRELLTGIFPTLTEVAHSGYWNDHVHTALLEHEWKSITGFAQGGAVATSSGTMALLQTLVSRDLKPGSGVIVPSYTFSGTYWPIIWAGLRPIVVDVNRDTGLMDPALIPQAALDSASAMIPVYIEGRVPDMPTLASIAASVGLELIEDAAQAHGMVAPDIGPASSLIDRVVIYSFNSSKHVPAGEGGMVVASNLDTANRIRAVGRFGEVRTRLSENPIIRAYHNEIMGINGRMSEITAALARVSTSWLSMMTRRAIENGTILNDALDTFSGIDGVVLPRVTTEHNYHKYRFQLPSLLYDGETDPLKTTLTVIDALNEAGVPATAWHTRPVACEPAFEHWIGRNYGTENAEYILSRSVILFGERHPLCVQDNAVVAEIAGTLVETLNGLIT